MHGRSPMIKDPRIPTTPGRSMSCRIFTDQADIACIYQAPSAVRCWARRMKGEPREGGEAKVITVLPPSYSSLSRMGEIIDVLRKK